MELDKNQKDLIYDLIFSKNKSYKINLSEYLSNIYEYEHFIEEIKKILKRANVKIVNSNINLNNKMVIWELKVKK